jgi:ferredoxin
MRGLNFPPARTDTAGMRITVDLTRCQAYAQCCFLAPGAFELAGREALLYVPEPDDGQRERVARAVAACPVGAIVMSEGAVDEQG